MNALHCMIVGGKHTRLKVYAGPPHFDIFTCISGEILVPEFQHFGNKQLGTREIRIPFASEHRIRLERNDHDFGGLLRFAYRTPHETGNR